MTFINPFKPDYGNGARGAVTISADTNWSALTDTTQDMQFTTLTIDNTKTLTLNGNHYPHIIRATTSVTINGNIQGNSLGFPGGAAAVESDKRGNQGTGYAPGLAGALSGNGGHALTSPFTNFLDWLMGGELVPAAGAGGGSGGGGNGGGGTAYGGAGGAGGAGLYIITPILTIAATAVITLNGAAGATVTTTGGDSTGGIFCALARQIVLGASGNLISAVGTANSANGKIYLCYLASISGSLADRCAPDAIGINMRALPIGLG